MSTVVYGVVGTALLLILFVLRVPIGLAMAFVGFVGFGIIVSFKAALNILVVDFFSAFNSYTLSVIPFFVLMGQIAYYSGISNKLYDAAYSFLGHYRGGLAMATVGASACFSAICGSTNASTATMALVALPEMKRYGYDIKLATGSIAAGGSLGILIPPSVIFVVYGILTRQSIGHLFLAGVIPGIILTLLFIASIHIWVRLNPEIAPRSEKASWKQRKDALFGVIEVLIIFVLVIGGLFMGMFTPTEAGAIGSGIILLISIIRREITKSDIIKAFYDSAKISCVILVIVAGASVFGHFLAITRLPQFLQLWLNSHSSNPLFVMFVIVVIYFIGGCFIDALALILLTVPVFYPVIVNLNLDPLWFGVLIVLVTQIGVITPPVGANVFVIKSIFPNIPLSSIFKGIIPFLIALLLFVIFIILFPGVVTFFPNLLYS